MAAALCIGFMQASVATAKEALASSTRPSAYVSLQLRGSNGYRIFVRGSSNGVRLVAAKHHEAAIYLVRDGVADQYGIRANLGTRGRIDLQFHMTEVKQKRGQPCRASRSEDVRLGYFSGVFVFHGENGFTSIKRQRIAGQIGDSFAGECPKSYGSEPPVDGDLDVGTRPKLEASSSFRSFIAGGDAISSVRSLVQSGVPLKLSTLPQAGVPYQAMSIEERIRLLIIRVLVAKGGFNSFSIDSDGKQAIVIPPKPFEGEAEYRGCARSSMLWRGTLKVSLPGLPDMALAGKKFFASLSPRTKCTVEDRE